MDDVRVEVEIQEIERLLDQVDTIHKINIALYSFIVGIAVGVYACFSLV